MQYTARSTQELAGSREVAWVEAGYRHILDNVCADEISQLACTGSVMVTWVTSCELTTDCTHVPGLFNSDIVHVLANNVDQDLGWQSE
jgi:hypothetical protein